MIESKPSRKPRYKLIIAGCLVFSLAAGVAPVCTYADAKSELAAAQSQLQEIGAEYQRLTEELNAAGAALDETNAQIDETKQKLSEAQDSLSDNVSTEYKGGGMNMLQVLLGADDFNDLISRVFYANKVNEAQADVIQEVRDLQQQLEDQKAEQEAALEETQAKVDEQTRNQQRAQALVNSLSAEVRAQVEAEAESNQQIAAAMQSAADGDANDESGAADVPVAGSNGNASDSVDNGSPSGSGSSPEAPSNQPSNPSHSGGATVSSPISYALAMAGAPYVSGGESMAEGGFDCSGLVYYAYRQIGITLPRSSGAQRSYFQSHGRWTTDRSQLQYGDVVFFPGHVAFYVGNGQVYGARRPGVGASTTSMSYFGTFLGGGQLYL